MKHLILISMLLIISISCYAQGAQESYTLFLLDFEDRSGIQNPLLARFNDTVSFVLSRQTGPVQVYLVSKPNRDALLAQAAAVQPDKPLLEQGLLAAERADADALVTGSYTKQGEQWSLEAQVYHRREGGKARQEIQIQGNSLYRLLDEFPAHLLQQFANAGHVALTTDSWKAYEEFHKGHQAFENYDFFLALEYYEKALALDPTLALAYAEQSHIYAMTGQPKKATEAIEAAKQWLPKASPMEQLAIRALAYSWDSEQNAYRDFGELWDLYGGVKHIPASIGPAGRSLSPDGVWDEPLLYQLAAAASMKEGKSAEADLHNQQWFNAIQQKTRAHPEDAGLLHDAAEYCLGIRQYVDEGIAMALKGMELTPEKVWQEEGYVLIKLHELKGDMEQSAEWARKIIQQLPDPRSLGAGWASWPPLAPGGYFFAWDHLAIFMHEGRISPERLLRWCEEVLDIPELHEPARVRTQYLIAEVYHAMNDNAKVEDTLAAIGAPRESDWMVIGPLDRAEGDLFPNPPPFAALFTDLEKTRVGIMGKEMQWEPWEDEQPLDGLLNIWWTLNTKYYDGGPYTHHQPPAIIYSCIYVKVPTAVEAQVRTGYGPMKVWLNENTSPVIAVEGIMAPIPDKVRRGISLAAGLNRFLVAIVSGNTYGFYFRITDRDGNPIPGLEFVSAREALSSD
jgi:tetratricopeptide (TPR) repeat protein